MSNMAWKSDLQHQDVSPRVSRPYLSVVQVPVSAAPRSMDVSVLDLAQGNAPSRNPGTPVQEHPIPSVKKDILDRADAARSAVRTSQGTRSNEAFLRRVLWALIIAFSLLIVGEVVFQLVLAPTMAIKTVNLDVDSGIPADLVRSTLGLDQPILYYSCDENQMADMLKTIPRVDQVTVTKTFPDTLSIHATARKALVISRVDGRFDAQGNPLAQGQSGIVLDQKGCAFAWSSDESANLPVLSGVNWQNFRLGLKLPDLVLPFLGDLEKIRTASADVYQAFSEFRLVPRGQHNLEVLVYTMVSPVPVRINGRLSSEDAMYILRTMSLLSAQHLDQGVVEVDFRTQNLILQKGDM